MIGYIPRAVVDPTWIVALDVPDPGAGITLGLKLRVVPAGTPVADRLTALLKPPPTVVVTDTDPWVPGAKDKADGTAETVRLGPC